MLSEERKITLRKNIKEYMFELENNQKCLQASIEELYELEKGPQGNIDIGWKRKGRELGFVL